VTDFNQQSSNPGVNRKISYAIPSFLSLSQSKNHSKTRASALTVNRTRISLAMLH
jgi:hypothetical protein